MEKSTFMKLGREFTKLGIHIYMIRHFLLIACDCNSWGSQTLQCDRVNGSCVCITGVGGHKCDTCARGFIGNAPQCQECGECFNNWDMIIGELKGG